MENLGFAISMLKRSKGTGEMNFKKYVSGTLPGGSVAKTAPQQGPGVHPLVGELEATA